MSNRRTPPNRKTRIQKVLIGKMKINPLAQREINTAWVDQLMTDFDFDVMGRPVVNKRGGWFYIIDGQHRVEALCRAGYDDIEIECDSYTGLSEQQEAEEFLRCNTGKAVPTFEKFRIAVNAARPDESDIERIVRSQDLCISRDKVPGAIGAVGTLTKVYKRGGAATLARTLRIVRDAYGDPGMQSQVIDGIGLLCQRYNGKLDDDGAIAKLGKVHGGVNGLLNNATQLHLTTGNKKSACVAAATVEVINRGNSKAKKLPPWWAT